MSTHYKVYGLFGVKPAEKAYFVGSRRAARSQALQDGAQVIYRVKKVTETALTRQVIGRSYGLLLLRGIGFQVEAGVPACKAMETAIESEPDESKRARLQPALDALARGLSLADAMDATGLYDTTVKSILMAGERTGATAAITASLEYLEDKKAGWKAWGLIFSALGMEVSQALTVPPTIQEWAIPWIRAHLPQSSPEQIAKYNEQLATIEFNNTLWMWFSYTVVLGIAMMGIAWLVNNRAKEWITHNILVRIPMIGDWYTNESIARSTKVFASMLKSGVRIGDAIQTILRSSTNAVARRFWEATNEAIQTGSPAKDAFSAGGLLRKDELLALSSAQGNEQIARAFSAISEDRKWRQKLLATRIFRMSMVVTIGYIVVTMLIAFKLFGLFNAGIEMTMDSMMKGS